MEVTIEIPDNLPKESVMRQVRELEEKLRREAACSAGQPPPDAVNDSCNRCRPDDLRILRAVKALVECGDIASARDMLSRLPQTVSPELDNWRRNLAEPYVTEMKTAENLNLRKDFAWLQENAAEFKGKWVALKDGILLNSHESQLRLVENLKQVGDLSGAMLFKVESQA